MHVLTDEGSELVLGVDVGTQSLRAGLFDLGGRPIVFADEALTTALVEVKGIGRWTAQMFLMFRLGRSDVLPDLDLGIQKGLQRAYGLRSMPKLRSSLQSMITASKLRSARAIR